MRVWFLEYWQNNWNSRHQSLGRNSSLISLRIVFMSSQENEPKHLIKAPSDLQKIGTIRQIWYYTVHAGRTDNEPRVCGNTEIICFFVLVQFYVFINLYDCNCYFSSYNARKFSQFLTYITILVYLQRRNQVSESKRNNCIPWTN